MDEGAHDEAARGIVPHSFEYFSERLDALQKEARECGYISVSILCESDPIGRIESKQINWYGPAAYCLGLITYAQNRFLTYLRSTEET